MRKLILICWLFLLPIIVLSQVAIYSECNYAGQSSLLGPGNYYNPFQFRIGDNTVSSIRVPIGFRVELYNDINMLGVPYVLRNNTSCLPGGFNNRISSIRITYNNNSPWEETNQDGGISVFTECQYRGKFAFLPPGNYPRLKNILGNEAISSFRVPQGMVLELFLGEDFRGTSTGKITADNSCLGGYWNNQAASARIYYAENGGWLPPAPPTWEERGTVRMYSGCSYMGRSLTFQSGVINNLRAQLNNMPLAALQLSPGMEVELYSGFNLTGTIVGRYTSNQSYLSPDIQFHALSARIYVRESGGGNWEGRGVALYGDCGFRGRVKTLIPGRYSNLRSSAVGISPSSLRVSPGYTIELFTETNFRGFSAGKITENEDCLGDFWRGRALSAIVTYNPSGGTGGYEDVVVYSDCYYRGRSQTVRPGYYNNMSSFQSANINPASLRVPQGYKLELFQQDNFSGAKITLTKDNPCIVDNWRGRIRSMIITYNGYGGNTPWTPGNDAVTVYRNCYFGGNNVKLSVGSFSSMSKIGMGSSGIASLKVPPGFEVELYQYVNFTGSRTILRSDNTCLGTTFRNRSGSIIIRRNKYYNTYQNQKTEE